MLIQNRRDFIHSLSALGLAGLLPVRLLALEKEIDKMVGIQLYTIRDLVKNDFTGTLKALAKIGYKTIEAAGYSDGKFYGYEPKAYKKILEDMGLVPLSSHSMVSMDNAKQVIYATAEAGMKYLIMPWWPEEKRKSMDNYKELAELLNKVGEKAHEAGLTFGYHNHAFEFDEFDGRVPYDYLLSNTNPETVCMQPDFYWMVYGGADPLTYFQKYPGRFKAWHVKDMVNGDSKDSTEIGSGKIDFKAIFAKKEEAGMECFFLEQESFTMDPMESLSKSFSYLSTL